MVSCLNLKVWQLNRHLAMISTLNHRADQLRQKINTKLGACQLEILYFYRWLDSEFNFNLSHMRTSVNIDCDASRLETCSSC